VTIPGSAEGPEVSGVGMLVAALVGGLGVGLAPPRGRRATLLRGAGLVVALLGVAGAGQVALDDPRAYALEHRIPRRAAGVRLLVPQRFAVIDERSDPLGGPWPLYPGLHDTLAQRVGHRVQVLVLPSAGEGDERSALLRVDETLARELVERPAPLPEAWPRAAGEGEGEGSAGLAEEALRTTVLRRNGQDVGLTIERPLPGGMSVVLVAAPADALASDASLHAAVLADARPDAD